MGNADFDVPLLLGKLSPGRLSWRAVLIIALFGLAVLIPGILGSTRTISSHEELAAQPAREMLSDGHWIIPTVVGVKRTEKPPTTGWLIAASMAVFHTDAEWAVRMPSLCSAILCSLVIAYLASRWLGELCGILAGVMQLVTVWVQTQANLAEADMPLSAAIAVAFAIFAVGNVDHPNGRRDTPWVRRAFMAAVGSAFLFKGPVALVFIFGGCILYLVLTRRWKQFRFFADPIGIAILLVLLIAWPLAALITYPPILYDWYREIFGYVGSQTFGGKPWWTYLANVPAYLLPWTLFLIPAAIATWKSRRWSDPFALFLLSWFIPGVLVLQAMKYKSIHYTYPLLPPFSIAMAAGLILWLRGQYTKPALPRMAVAIAMVIAAAGGIVFIGLAHPKLPSSIPALIVIVAGGLLLVTWLEHRRRLVAELVALMVTVGAAVVVADVTIIPNMPGARARLAFAQEVTQRLPVGETLYYVGFETDEIQWYVRKPAVRMDNVDAFAKAVTVDAPIYVLTRKQAMEDLNRHFAVEVIDTIRVPSSADLQNHEAKRPYLVKLSAGRAGSDAPSAHPATQAATGPASAPAQPPVSTQPER